MAGLIEGELIPMRKVVIEVSRSYLSRVKGSEKIESLKIVHTLRFDAEGFSGVCKLRLRDPDGQVGKLVGLLGITKIKPISKEKDGSHLVYVEGKPMAHWMRVSSPRDGYQYPPFELTDRSWRKTFLGSETQIRRMLERAEKAGLKFKIG